MRTIYCDTKDCINSKIMPSWGVPEGWHEFKLTVAHYATPALTKDFCPDCCKKMPAVNRIKKTENRTESMEKIFREIIQDLLTGIQKDGDI